MKRQQRRLGCVERLEMRHLMAGNIVAQQVGEDLVITGDDAGNTLTIESNGEDSFSLVGKHPDAATPDTTINGAQGWQFNGISGSIAIRLQGGGDGLFLKQNENMVIKKALLIDMGAGE